MPSAPAAVVGTLLPQVAAELGLQPPRGLDLGKEEPAGKEPARLLAEADERSHGVAVTGSAVFPRAPDAAWRMRLSSTQAAHPIKLYQR